MSVFLGSCVSEKKTNTKRGIKLETNQVDVTNNAPIHSESSANQKFIVFQNGKSAQLRPTLETVFDIDNDLLVYSLKKQPLFGKITNCLGVSINPEDKPGGLASFQDLICDYSYPDSFLGTDSFTYQASDQRGGTLDIDVQIDVVAKPLLQITTPALSVSVIENGGPQSLDFTSALVVTSSTVALTYSYYLKTPPKFGSLTDCMGLSNSSASDTICFYTPFADVNGTNIDFLQVGVRDSFGDESFLNVTISITSTNSAPVVTDSGATRTIKMNYPAQSLDITPISVSDADASDILL